MSLNLFRRASVEYDDTHDIEMLQELGYSQQLTRRFGVFSNFAVSFSSISILTGCVTSYLIAMNAGGPVAISIGWPLVGVFVICVALAMAEVCSVYPTAAGLYFWAGRLARKNHRQWAWTVGWFNFLGEVAVTAAVDYGAAVTWMALLNLVVGTPVTPLGTFIAFVVIILIHAVLNAFNVNLVHMLSSVSAWWHLAGAAIIVVALIVLPHHHQSAGWVFTHFENNTGWHSGIYVFLIGLLMAQYTLTGFDASAHVAEETRNASTTAPQGMIRSVVVSIVAGWILLLAVTFAIQSWVGARDSSIGLPPAQIFIDATGHGMGVVLLLIAAVAQFFCGMACVTASSRMAFAFSRDNALPGSRLWSKVNEKRGVPTNSIWLVVAVAIVLASPALFNTTAYLAVTSIAVIGLYIAYVIPVYLRLRNPEFVQGRWNLGRFSKPIGWISVIWVVFIVVLFMLPPSSPININSFNYAPIAVLLVIALAVGTWFASGRRRFMQSDTEAVFAASAPTVADPTVDDLDVDAIG